MMIKFCMTVGYIASLDQRGVAISWGQPKDEHGRFVSRTPEGYIYAHNLMWAFPCMSNVKHFPR
jgi:hypothetical protein